LPEKITSGEVVAAFKKVLGYKALTPVIPLPVITVAASVLGMMNFPIVRKMGMVPERIVKLVRSTNISSQKLVGSGFTFQYHLEDALKDWSAECGGSHLF
jgi:hypothetical protein